MERISLFIQQLNNQLKDGADIEKLYASAQMLLIELHGKLQKPAQQFDKVVVTYPIQHLTVVNYKEQVVTKTVEKIVPVYVQQQPEVTEPVATVQEAEVKVEPVIEMTSTAEEEIVAEQTSPALERLNEASVQVEAVTPAEPLLEIKEVHITEENVAPIELSIDVTQDPPVHSDEIQKRKQSIYKDITIPRLPHLDKRAPKTVIQENGEKKEIFTLQNLFEVEDEDTSVNAKIKEDKKEIAQVLKETPIRDLKKAININDRYMFIGELFRGDESMFERSIKTINTFTIYPEAEYWIRRELKTKLGWADASPIVKHFDELVKRRFA